MYIRKFWCAFLIIIAVTIIGGEFTANATVLDIRPHRQNTLVWCWGASAAMVVEYMTGQKIEDCEVLSDYDRQLGGIGNCCGGNSSCLRGAIPGEIENILGQIYDIDSLPQPNPITYDEIVNQIDNGKPIIIWLWRSPVSAHVVVIAGYSNPNTVVIIDPMSGRRNVPYSVLLANWQTGMWRDTITITSDRHISSHGLKSLSQPVANHCCDLLGKKRCFIPPASIGVTCYCNGIPGTGISCQ